jgi:hypothetical protein
MTERLDAYVLPPPKAAQLPTRTVGSWGRPATGLLAKGVISACRERGGFAAHGVLRFKGVVAATTSLGDGRH